MKDAIWESAQRKILKAQFPLTQEELRVFKYRFKNKFYESSNILYKVLDEASSYSELDYDNLIKIIYSLKENLIVNWLQRNIIWSTYRSLKNYENKEIHNFQASKAAKALLKIKKDKPLRSQIVTTMIGLLNNKRTTIERFFDLVDYLTPYLCKNRDEIVAYVFKQSHKNNAFFSASLKLRHLASDSDKETSYKKIEQVLLNRTNNSNNRKVVLSAMNNDWFVDGMKNTNDPRVIERLGQFLVKSELRDIELNNFAAVKQLQELEKTCNSGSLDEIISKIQDRYIAYVYRRSYGHMRSNRRKLINFLETIQGASPKKALYALTKINNSSSKSDVSFLIKKFPELEKLTMLA